MANLKQTLDATFFTPWYVCEHTTDARHVWREDKTAAPHATATCLDAVALVERRRRETTLLEHLLTEEYITIHR
jgi:hypothetical protein